MILIISSVLLFISSCSSYVFDDPYGLSYPAAPNCSCGRTYTEQGKIINGEETGVNKYTFMVFLVLEDDENQGFQCGGSILTSRHVITAAHCTDGIRPRKMLISVGDHNLSTTTETMFTQRSRIIAKYEHPGYSNENAENDISILVTRDRIRFNVAVGPICMPTRRINIDWENVKIIGWGTTEDGKLSDVLKDADTTVLSRNYCEMFWSGITSRQQCVYDMTRAVCFGDSGGPVSYLDPEEKLYILTGIVSFVRFRPCDPDYPTVNTFVPAHIKWIQRTISRSRADTGETLRTCSID